MKKNRNLIDISGSRTSEQQAVMEQIARDGVCPFCTEHLAKYHQQPVLWKNQDWLITRNDTPYEGSEIHLLLICTHHIENLSKLDEMGWISLGQAVAWATKNFKIKGGTFLMRFGDMGFNGATVQHLHAHIVVGVRKTQKTSSLRVKIGHKRE